MTVTHLLDGSQSAVKMTAEGRQLDDAAWKRLLLEAQIARKVAAQTAAALHFHGSWIESMTFKNEKYHRFYVRTELCAASLAALKQQGHSFNETALSSILTQVRTCPGLKNNYPGSQVVKHERKQPVRDLVLGPMFRTTNCWSHEKLTITLCQSVDSAQCRCTRSE